MLAEYHTHLAGRNRAVRQDGDSFCLAYQCVADYIVHDGAIAFLLLQGEHHVRLGIKAVKFDVGVVLLHIDILYR